MLIAYINKFGGTRSLALMNLARQIWNLCLRTDTRLHLFYVRSSFKPADRPCRQLTRQLGMEDSTNFLQETGEEIGPTLSRSVYISPESPFSRLRLLELGSTSVSMDVTFLSWKTLGRVYLCPPWNFLPAVVTKLQGEYISATSITLCWPSAIWFSTLKTLARARPLKLPRHFVRLSQGENTSVLCGNPHLSPDCLENKIRTPEEIRPTRLILSCEQTHRYLSYAQIQAKYLVGADIATSVLKFLTDLGNYRSAILDSFELRDHLFLLVFKTFHSLGSSNSMAISDLTAKLCWLLGVCASYDLRT